MGTQIIRPAEATSKDNFLDSQAPNFNEALASFVAIQTNPLPLVKVYRAILQYDLTQLTIATGARVTHAVFMGQLVAAGVLGAVPLTVECHRITNEWQEGNQFGLPGISNWVNRLDGPIAWAVPGGDYDATLIDSLTCQNAVLREAGWLWHHYRMTTQVRNWLDGVHPNYGFILKAPDAAESAAYSEADYWSANAAVGGGGPLNHPLLWVEDDRSPVNLIPIIDGVTIGLGLTAALEPEPWRGVAIPPSLGAGQTPLDSVVQALRSNGDGSGAGFLTTSPVPGLAGYTYGVTVHGRVRRHIAAGTSGVEFGLRIGGVNYWSGVVHAIPNDVVWRSFEDTWVTNPAGGRWTRDAVNGIELLARRVGGTTDFYLCRLYAAIPFALAEVYPDMQHADLTCESTYSTEVTEYETGYVQRNALWIAPRALFRFRYGILTEPQYRLLWNFWSEHRGAYGAFWLQDYTEPNPVNKMIARAGGAATEFKLPVDYMDAAVIYRDGVVDALAAVDLTTGVVAYAAAPPAGSVLTFDATNAYYRVRFQTDPLPADRHKFIAWGGEVRLTQVKMDA